MNPGQSLERYLPFGYLFLVVMGIVKESVLFYQIGINILKYSSIADILMSPIASLTSHPLIFIVVMTTMLLGYYFPKMVENKVHKPWVQKTMELKDVASMSKEEITKQMSKKAIQMTSVMVICVFLGMGFGEGLSNSRRIKKGEMKTEHTLVFNSGEEQEVALLNSNSQYYFYVPKDSKIVHIAPINSIKVLELTENRMLD